MEASERHGPPAPKAATADHAQMRGRLWQSMAAYEACPAIREILAARSNCARSAPGNEEIGEGGGGGSGAEGVNALLQGSDLRDGEHAAGQATKLGAHLVGAQGIGVGAASV